MAIELIQNISIHMMLHTLHELVQICSSHNEDFANGKEKKSQPPEDKKGNWILTGK